MTTRRTFLARTLGLLAAPLAAQAQPAGRVYRIGFLSSGSRSTTPVDRFLRELRELGFREGQTLAIEWSWAEARPERLSALAADLVRLKVDVIVAPLNPEIFAAKQATASIPIVMVAAADPVGVGLIAGLAHPGGNVTGTTTHTPEVGGKILEVLKEAVPKSARVALIWDPAYPGFSRYYGEAENVARLLGVTLQSIEVRTPGDVVAAFAKLGAERPDALFVSPTGAIATHRAQILDFAAKHRLPAIYASRTFVDAGGLMSYSAHLADLFRRAATFVDKILKGAKPADLPVEQPTRFELVVNLKTAKALGLTIPPSVLLRADEVIE